MTSKTQTSSRAFSIASKLAIAIVAVGAAAILTNLLGDVLAGAPTVLFFYAVIIASWYGGIWAGLIAIILSSLIVDYFFTIPSTSATNIPRLVTFTITAMLISWLNASRRRAEESLRQAHGELEIKVELRTAELSKANELLKEEIAERKKVEQERESLMSQLETEHALFETVLRQMPAGVVIAEAPSGKLIMGNQQVEHILGHQLTLAEGVKDYWGDYACYDAEGRTYKPDQMPLARSLLTGEVIINEEIHFERGDGTAGYVLLSSTPVRDREGNIIAAVAVSHDITEQKEGAEALNQSQRRYQELFENANDIIYTLDLKGNLVSLNKAGERITGYTREAMLGKPITAIVAPEQIEPMLEMMTRKLDGETITTYELGVIAVDKRRLTFEISSRLIYEGGRAVGVQGIARDMTERKRAEAEREHLLAREQVARKEAEAANRMKDEFLATVSHELRTPLNAILGWAELLRAGHLDPTFASRGLDTIVRNAKSQAQLIEDILDVSRIITGKLRLDVQRVGLIPIINAAVDGVRPAAFAKEIDLETHLDPKVAPVTGDPGRLQQIVWNLLSNAIKFTPPGGRVEVRLEQTAQDVQIVVSDSGAGINRDFLPHVFDRFRQADSSYTRRHGGLGLGLAIVRHLVEMHGGTVEAESRGEGQGATFIVALPLPQMRALDTGPLLASRRNDGAGADDQSVILAGLRALVVDDEPDACELIKVSLEQFGAEVVTTGNAADAITALMASNDGKRLDVILSDIGMPDEDGIYLISRLREIGPGAKIPAIALTAYARDEDRARALDAGFDLHIAKPFNPLELASAVASIARKTQSSGR